MFKRRTPRTYTQAVSEAVYPRGGWRRASRYIVYRLRRLPDPAHKISRGIAAGVFASFTPFYGLHFFTAALLAWAMRGNILASLLATFFGNPITFPIIASISVEMGTWMLGLGRVPPTEILLAFSLASVELWDNFLAIFTAEEARWSSLASFFRRIFVPYLVGGIVPGVFTALAAYMLANPIIASYQKGRIARMKRQFEARRKAAEEAKAARLREEAEALRRQREEAEAISGAAPGE